MEMEHVRAFGYQGPVAIIANPMVMSRFAAYKVAAQMLQLYQ